MGVSDEHGTTRRSSVDEDGSRQQPYSSSTPEERARVERAVIEELEQSSVPLEVPQLVERTGCPTELVRRVLAKLVAAKVIRRTTRGRQSYYSI